MRISPLMQGYVALFVLLGMASGALGITKQLITDQSVFPAAGARPPLWPFRPLSSANYTCEKMLYGGWKLTVNHKAINVNSTHMTWLFKNLATGVAVSSIDNKVYPMFLLMHPRDHIQHKASASPLAVGKEAKWVEFPLTGCTASGTAWTCPTSPAANPGFTKATPVASWSQQDQVNGTSKVLTFISSMIEFGTTGCNNAGCYNPVIRTKQAWSYNTAKKTTTVTTTLRIGFGNAAYDKDVTTNWANGLDPEVKCRRMAQHYVEEYGALELWLPGAYAKGGK